MEEERYHIDKNRNSRGREWGEDRWEKPQQGWRDEQDFFQEEEPPARKAPLLIRLVAWLSLIAVFIAIGYGGTTLMFKWMDSRNMKEPGLIGSSDDARRLVVPVEGEAREQSVAEIEKSFTLYIPEEGVTFESRTVRILGDYEEDQLQRLLASYLDALKEGKWTDPNAQLLSLYRSGDWIYLNLNAAFYQAIKPLGKEKAQLLLTGLIKTVTENFPAVKKVKFYSDGREIKVKEPVDLSRPWMLPDGQ